jgi:ribose transport system substrate-binding protein
VRSKVRRRGASAAALAVSLAAVGCGGDDDSSSPPTSADAAATTAVVAASSTAASSSARTTGGAAATGDLAAEAAALYEGTYQQPPSSSPPAATGKKVWVISCGEAAAGCAALAGGAKEGSEALGWEVTLYDGKLGADGAYANGVRQAVAAGANAIIVGAIDCALLAQPLAEAKEAGVLVISAGAYDCDDPRAGGGTQLFDASVFADSSRTDISAESKFNGDTRAVWLLNKAGTSNLKVLVFEHTDSLLGLDYAAGFTERVERDCSTCEIIPVEFTFADLATGAIGTKAADALTKHPDANALFVPYDSLLLLGVAQAVVRSGRVDSLDVVGGEGYTPNLELIRTGGGQNFAVGSSGAWVGWAAADTTNRLFNGEDPVAEGYGYQFIDAEHMHDDDGVAYIPPIDYKTAYRAAWKVT